MALESLQKVRRPLNIGGTVLLILILIPFVAFAVPQLVGATQSYIVVSNSMTPAIHSGDVVFVYDATPSEIETGDIITYQTPEGGQVTTHKVVEVVNEDGRRMYQTKGTANEEKDPYLVPHEAVIGKVMFHIPYIGVIVGFAMTDVGLVTLVIVPAGLLMLSELFTLLRAVKRR